jgi:hypothetical protein
MDLLELYKTIEEEEFVVDGDKTLKTIFDLVTFLRIEFVLLLPLVKERREQVRFPVKRELEIERLRIPRLMDI